MQARQKHYIPLHELFSINIFKKLSTYRNTNQVNEHASFEFSLLY